MVIRSERPIEIAAVNEVVAAAFARPDEAKLVACLRADGDAVISLVAVDGGKIVGHVMFSRMTASFPALGLGPVSVRPERQRSGVGSRLVREGLTRAQEGGWKAVFVLGDPGYYRRFGFDPALASGFRCRYAGPHLMALALGSGSVTGGAMVDYPTAFGALG